MRKSDHNRQAVQDLEPRFCALIGGGIDCGHKDLPRKDRRGRNAPKDRA